MHHSIYTGNIGYAYQKQHYKSKHFQTIKKMYSEPHFNNFSTSQTLQMFCSTLHGLIRRMYDVWETFFLLMSPTRGMLSREILRDDKVGYWKPFTFLYWIMHLCLWLVGESTKY